MSWPQWPVGGTPALAAGVINSAPNVVNPALVSGTASAVLPPGAQYTPEQWAQMQQQNWQQWAQWQQQYQQWHQQYGAEYQKSMTALTTQSTFQPPLPPASNVTPNTAVPPPPVDAKPPLPPEDSPQSQKKFPTPAVPPTGFDKPPQGPPDNANTRYPNTDNRGGYNNRNRQNWQTKGNNPNQRFNSGASNQLPSLLDLNFSKPPSFDNDTSKPPPFDHTMSKPPPFDNKMSRPPPFDNNSSKRGMVPQNEMDPKRNKVGDDWSYQTKETEPHNQWSSEHQQPPPPVNKEPLHQWSSDHQAPPPVNKVEELSEAEKKFDKQFADWEAQFAKWKEQNSSHPDKDQYRQYEKKWETWRMQLLERREQMRRKRLQMASNSPNLNPKPVGTDVKTDDSKVGVKPPISGQHNPDPFGKPANFNRPPPTINNEPLDFKKSAGIEEESEQEKKEFDTSFLASNSSGGIPGLDLVKDDEGNADKEEEEVVELDPVVEKKTEQAKTANLEALSKGLNNILGDPKLLSMLSMVSQNQNLNLSGSINTLSNMPKPDNTPSDVEELSNQCIDESSRSNFGLNRMESVHNFDDQTQSSFDGINRNNDNFNQGLPGPDHFSREPPNNFNRNQDMYNRPPGNFDNDNFNRGPNNFNRGPDNFNRGPDNMNRGPGPDNMNRGPGPDNMNRGPGQDNFFRAQDSFNRGPNNFNRGPDNFNRDPDNFNRGPNDFNRGPDFNKGPDNFNRAPGNLNRGPDFNKGSDNFNRGPDNLNRGPDNFNRGPDNFNRAPDNFNRGPNNFNRGPDNFNRGPDFKRGPDNFSKGPDNFNRGPENFNKGPDNFNKGPENFNRGPDNLNRGPENINRGPDNFNRGPNNFNRGPDNFNKGPDNFNRGPDNFNRGPDNFNRGPDNFNRGPDNFNRGPDNFNRGPDNFKRGPDNFNRGPDNFDRGPNNFNRGPDDFNRGPNNNRGPEGFDRALGNYNRGPNNFAGPGGPNTFGRDNDFNRNAPNDFSGRFNRNNNQGNFGEHNRFDDDGAPRDNWFEPPPKDNFDDPDREWPRNEIGDDQTNKFSNEGSNYESQDVPHPDPNKPEEIPAGDESAAMDILKPTTVIDYDHKTLKATEPEVIIEPVQTFDYRHKPVNRIPLPQRPKWLSLAFKNIHQFDPLTTRLELRRYGDIRYDDRRMYDDYYDDRKPARGGHYEDPPSAEGPTFPEKRRFGYDDRRRGSKDREIVLRKNEPSYDEKESEFDTRQRYRDRSPTNKFESSDRYKNERYAGNRSARDSDERFASNISGRDSNERFASNRSGRDSDERFASNRSGRDSDERFASNRSGRDSDERFASNKSDRDSPIFIKTDDTRKKQEVVNLTPPVTSASGNSKVTLIEDLLCPPGRFNRPSRIVIILRGPPGSGKTSLAKLIKDKEVENGGSAPRILSLDDYFMVEQEREVLEDGKKVKIKDMKYEYEECMEASYRTSLMKSFKKTITDGYFNFIIVDNVNDKVKYFGEMWSFAKQNGFQVYICQLDLDVQTCSKRNIHDRTEGDIEKCVAGWETTPSHHPVVDATSLIQSGSIPEVEMEEINSPASNFESDGDEEQGCRSKWDNFDCSSQNLAKLDGTNKPLKHSTTMEDYLQLDDDWTPSTQSKPGQKRVRWADLEERKEQEKMRAIGFVVGQTNWNRMMDPTMGGSALTQTKYIERVGKY